MALAWKGWRGVILGFFFQRGCRIYYFLLFRSLAASEKERSHGLD